jgi:hypothetical protein
MLRAQQAAIAQTKAIEQYMSMGCKFEATKQWENAEKSFKYVLQVVARRDGPGSTNSIPALHHLVTVTEAQNKIDEAITFQKTVLAFAKAAKVPDYGGVVSEQVNLSNLFMRKEDYASATPVLNEAIASYDACPQLSNEQRCALLAAYTKLLSKTRKPTHSDTSRPSDADHPKPTDDSVAPVTTAKESLPPIDTAVLKTDDQLLKPIDGLPEISPPSGEGGPQTIPVVPEVNQPPTKEQR